MNRLDAINTAFEAVGACFVYANVVALYRAKRVTGVYWPTQGFFAAWGGWNLVYYAGVGHWGSFAGQVAMVIGQLTWVVLALKYRGRS